MFHLLWSDRGIYKALPSSPSLGGRLSLTFVLEELYISIRMKCSLVFHSFLLSSLAAGAPLRVSLSRRSVPGNVEQINPSEFLLFTGQIEVGTPPQKLVALFDTGSANVVVNINTNCPQGGCINGAFDPSRSSTAVNTTVDFDIEFMDGTSAVGYVFNDTLTVAGLTQNAVIGVSSISDYSNVVGLTHTSKKPSPVVTDRFRDQGVLERSVFSTYFDGSEGSIVFGGMDKGKFSGTLERVPVHSDGLWTIDLSGVSSECGYTNDNVLPLVLDTGAQVSFLPTYLYSQIQQHFGGRVTQEGSYLFKCSDATALTFDFSGKSIVMDPRTFVVPALDSQGNTLSDTNSNEICMTTISPTDANFTLGLDLLQNMFVVFDSDNAEVAIAQYSGGLEEIVEITGDIPGSIDAANAGKVMQSSENTSYDTPATTSIQGANPDMAFYQGTFANECPKTSSPSGSSSQAISSSSNHIITSSITITRTTNVATCFPCVTKIPTPTNTFITSYHTITRTTGSPACFNCASTIADTVTSCPGGCSMVSTYSSKTQARHNVTEHSSVPLFETSSHSVESSSFSTYYATSPSEETYSSSSTPAFSTVESPSDNNTSVLSSTFEATSSSTEAQSSATSTTTLTTMTTDFITSVTVITTVPSTTASPAFDVVSTTENAFMSSEAPDFSSSEAPAVSSFETSVPYAMEKTLSVLPILSQADFSSVETTLLSITLTTSIRVVTTPLTLTASVDSSSALRTVQQQIKSNSSISSVISTPVISTFEGSAALVASPIVILLFSFLL